MELPFAVEQTSLEVEQQHQLRLAGLVTTTTQPNRGLNPMFGTAASPPPVRRMDENAAVVYRANVPGTAATAAPLRTAPISEKPKSYVIPGTGTTRLPSLFAPFSFSSKPANQNSSAYEEKDDSFDFATYVNVQETDADEVDILLAGGDPGTGKQQDPRYESPPELDTLTLLLSGAPQNDCPQLVSLSEQATAKMNEGMEAKRRGDLQRALNAHSASAKLFHEAALILREKNASIAQSFLMLSQTEAKAALALQRIMNVRPNGLPLEAFTQQKQRIRETVRGALESRPEADISESAFLGTVSKKAQMASSNPVTPDAKVERKHSNAVDEMMQLERELRDMDMALELGNSIASLDSKRKSNGIDGSFMVVPGSGSYMSSSMVLGSAPTVPSSSKPSIGSTGGTHGNRSVSGMAGARARANRLPKSTRAGSTPVSVMSNTPPRGPQHTQTAQGLESSWWGGNASTTMGASQILSSSVISIASTAGGMGGGDSSSQDGSQPANNKQLMRLMDALKRLGDENAALLKEVEAAEAARNEAQAAKREMQRFKDEYSKRFTDLKAALEKFRKNYPANGEGQPTAPNPVSSSEFLRAASASEHNARQEQLIRKLTADLKKEKEESKKKDAALRKYERYYREVKARSAQKAAQRQKELEEKQAPRTLSSQVRK